MGVLFIVTWVVIMGTVHSGTEEDKKFCEFLTREVFTPGNYIVNNVMNATPEIYLKYYGKEEVRIQKAKQIKIEKFEIQLMENHYQNYCVVRAQMDSSFWITALMIDLNKISSGRHQDKIAIIPDPATNETGMTYLQEVKWSEVSKDERAVFQKVWSLDPTERIHILQICDEEVIKKKSDTIQKMMECLDTKLKNLQSQFKENNTTKEGEEKPLDCATSQSKENISAKEGEAKSANEIAQPGISYFWIIINVIGSLIILMGVMLYCLCFQTNTDDTSESTYDYYDDYYAEAAAENVDDLTCAEEWNDPEEPSQEIAEDGSSILFTETIDTHSGTTDSLFS